MNCYFSGTINKLSCEVFSYTESGRELTSKIARVDSRQTDENILRGTVKKEPHSPQDQLQENVHCTLKFQEMLY